MRSSDKAIENFSAIPEDVSKEVCIVKVDDRQYGDINKIRILDKDCLLPPTKTARDKVPGLGRFRIHESQSGRELPGHSC